MLTLEKEIRKVKGWKGPRVSGRVTHVIGLLIESLGPQTYVGEVCRVYGRNGEMIPCQVVGFKENKVLLMPHGEITHIAPGSEVYPTDQVHTVSVASSLCGRVLDALGEPIDGKGPLFAETHYPVVAPPPEALARGRIEQVLPTGVRAIDALCTLGRGQRMGIFAGSGVGKSTLMGMIARGTAADINVIALIGERGREVREFIERDLGPEGLARSVVVVATSDQAALLRSKGANVATAIAEYFRDCGKNVLLMMDSISRFAMARREIGLAIGEPPTTKGYTPSVFAELPRLVERAGNGSVGSITGIYTILAEGDDLNDPIADQMRSLLDGHIVLSRKLASAGHFPPIDPLVSLSRVMSSLVGERHQKSALKVRDLLQAYHEGEELIQIGAYVAGSDSKIDAAIEKRSQFEAFFCQSDREAASWEMTKDQLMRIAG